MFDDGVSLEGYVDSDGVAAIQEGGVAHFMTESGMQSCDVTRVTTLNETLFSLETSCGQGTLELAGDNDDTSSGRRLTTGTVVDIVYNLVSASLYFLFLFYNKFLISHKTCSFVP